MKFTLSRASQIGLCLCHIMSSTTRGGHAQTDIYTHAQVQAPTNVCASQRISISIGLHIYLYWPTGVLSIVIKQKKKNTLDLPSIDQNKCTATRAFMPTKLQHILPPINQIDSSVLTINRIPYGK